MPSGAISQVATCCTNASTSVPRSLPACTPTARPIGRVCAAWWTSCCRATKRLSGMPRRPKRKGRPRREHRKGRAEFEPTIAPHYHDGIRRHRRLTPRGGFLARWRRNGGSTDGDGGSTDLITGRKYRAGVNRHDPLPSGDGCGEMVGGPGDFKRQGNWDRNDRRRALKIWSRLVKTSGLGLQRAQGRLPQNRIGFISL